MVEKQKTVKFTQDELHELHFAVKVLQAHASAEEPLGVLKKIDRAINWTHR